MEITVQKTKDYTVNNIAFIINPTTSAIQAHLIISGLDDIKLDITSVDISSWLEENKDTINNEILTYINNIL
jgi:hypothetical protein